MHLALVMLQFVNLTTACATPFRLAQHITKTGPGCNALVRLLLARGADPNAKATGELEGVTPLHLACCWAGGEWLL
jgi:hypothetical protein